MSRVHVIAAIALLVPVVSFAQRPASTAQTATKPPQSVAPADVPGGIRILNRGPTALKVEIAVPIGDDCTKRRATVSKAILPGGGWVMRSSQPLCIRRERVDAGVARMQPWERKVTRMGHVEEVVL